MVLLDEPQVVPLGVENLPAQIALTEHRVTGDQAAFQHHTVEQSKGGLVFIRLVVTAVGDLGLGDRQPRLVGDQRQQMHGLVQAVETAASGFPVQGARLGWPLVSSERSAQEGLSPPGQGTLECGPVQRDEHLADATELGGGSGEPEAVHEGDVVIDGPLCDGGIAPRTAHDGAANQSQYSG